MSRRALARRFLAGGLVTVPAGRSAWPLSPIPSTLISFAAGSAELDWEAQDRLHGVAAMALRRPDLSLLADGYPDPEEREAVRLPAARAAACAAFLRINGVAASRIAERSDRAAMLAAAQSLEWFNLQRPIAVVGWT